MECESGFRQYETTHKFVGLMLPYHFRGYHAILRKHEADWNMAYFTYMDFPVQLQRCIYTMNWIERLNKEYKMDDKNGSIDAIRRVGTFPPGKCCHGRNRDSITAEKYINGNFGNKRKRNEE